MKIYISGISGTGMGPLALMAKGAGFAVFGSDISRGAIYDELIKAGVEVSIGEQDGSFLKEKIAEVDWFVYTSALAADHPELMIAKEAGVRVSKRDELTAFLVSELGLKMIAVAGTHGKTTTTSMIVFAALKLNLPVSYIVGTTLGFAVSGKYAAGDKYFIYEADEYDRNFLKYQPWLAVIPTISYDHPDIYPTEADYAAAFAQFKAQSQKVFELKDGKLEEDGKILDGALGAGDFKLAGEARREDALLATYAVKEILLDSKRENVEVVDVLNEFPGVGRRFERISEGVYSDYAHHPEEIAATMGVAEDEKKLREKKGIVVIYQPHQNTRQHEVFSGYRAAFRGADKIFWLPTYLTRENPDLRVLEPAEFIETLENREVAEAAEANEELLVKIREYVKENYLVVLMTAGPADEWLRKNL